MDFYEPEIHVIFSQFLVYEKISKFKNSFSHDSVLTCTLMIHIRNNFDPSNLWSQRGFCLIAQNPVIRGLQLEQAAEIIILSSGPNCTWLVVHLDR